METQIKTIIEKAKEAMAKTQSHLETELSKIRAGKASPAMLDSVRIDYYGTSTPLNQVGSVAAPDTKTLTIQPFEKRLIPTIERAIVEANLGFTPQNDGQMIRIVLPPLSEERRKQIVKQAKETCEESKIAIRNLRREFNEMAKKLAKELGEDAVKACEKEIQTLTDANIKKVDEQFSKKEAEILKV
ncbi:MAG: ribosome recycling factor [Bacteroidia bacterium]|nr:ribosome recycling factor [Bacteroidia bacterium]